MTIPASPSASPSGLEPWSRPDGTVANRIRVKIKGVRAWVDLGPDAARAQTLIDPVRVRAKAGESWASIDRWVRAQLAKPWAPPKLGVPTLSEFARKWVEVAPSIGLTAEKASEDAQTFVLLGERALAIYGKCTPVLRTAYDDPGRPAARLTLADLAENNFVADLIAQCRNGSDSTKVAARLNTLTTNLQAVAAMFREEMRDALKQEGYSLPEFREVFALIPPQDCGRLNPEGPSPDRVIAAFNFMPRLAASDFEAYKAASLALRAGFLPVILEVADTRLVRHGHLFLQADADDAVWIPGPVGRFLRELPPGPVLAGAVWQRQETCARASRLLRANGLKGLPYLADMYTLFVVSSCPRPILPQVLSRYGSTQALRVFNAWPKLPPGLFGRWQEPLLLPPAQPAA